MLDSPRINTLAILVSAIATTVLYYFWASRTGARTIREDGTSVHMPTTSEAVIKVFVSSLVFGFGMSYFFGSWRVSNNLEQAMNGIYYGILAFVGFVLPTLYFRDLQDGRTTKLYFADLAFYFAASILAGVIIALMV